MPAVIPTTVAEVVDLLTDSPDAMLLAGGTDAMVEINDGRVRPDGLVIALDAVAELRSWRHEPASSTLVIGSGVTYTELMLNPPAALVPALAEASRTVGSPQIRNAGTLGGNLATCSPAGDGLPVLAALDARVTLASAAGTRELPVMEFMIGVKRTALEPGELITEITVPVVDGWQGYAKVGVRNAMVIAVATACLVIDRPGRSVRLALGSVGPTILRCPDAESFLAAAIDWETMAADPDALARFGELASDTSRPITDHRSTAEYRRHAVGVLATRLSRRGVGRSEVAA